MDLNEYQKQYIGQKVLKTEIKWSAAYKGLGLRLNPNGKHKWISYSSVDGKKIYKTIGGMELPYKAALKAFLASKHDKSLIELMEQQTSSSESPLIRDYAPIFIERHLAKAWKVPKEPAYRVAQIVKKLGNIRIADLRVEDCEMLKATASTKSSANTQLRVLSVMWKRAVAWGMVKNPNGTIPSNPCSFVKQYTLQPRSNYLNSEDFDKLWKALEIDENLPVRCAIQLLCLTGCRKNEVLGLKWSDIDYKEGYINITEDKSKNKRPHFIKITPTIHHVLRNVPQDGEYLFTSPSNRNGYIQNIRKPFERIKERAGVNPDITIHDIRRSVTTYLKSRGHDDLSIAAAVNHKSITTTQRHYIQIERTRQAEVLADMSEKFSLIKDGYSDPLFQSSSPS
jgi:integrase